jgi:hypothetical protein
LYSSPNISRIEESGELNECECRKHRIYQTCMQHFSFKKRTLVRKYGTGHGWFRMGYRVNLL